MLPPGSNSSTLIISTCSTVGLVVELLIGAYRLLVYKQARHNGMEHVAGPGTLAWIMG